MADKPDLTDQQRRTIADRYVAGEKQKALGDEYGISQWAVSKIVKELGASRPKPAAATASTIKAFSKRVRSILWRQDGGNSKKTYEAWRARVDELQAEDGSNYTHEQAVVAASKDFKCLTRLFREYDVSAFDPNPGSHADIVQYGKATVDAADIACEHTEQTYRDSLRWAIAAAGRYLRTKDHPVVCPCDAAFYLYRQAIEEPKDFMSKVNQIESKADAEAEARKNSRKHSDRATQEIDMMLTELQSEEDSDGSD